MVARRRRAARTATSASVATATSAGPTAMTATIDSAAAHSASNPWRISSRPVRIAVLPPAVTFADGYSHLEAAEGGDESRHGTGR